MPRDIDKVRFYVGDTVSTDQLFSDQEIEFALTEAGSIRSAATLCANRKAAEWARYADLKEGQLSISYSQRSQQMLAIADAIQESATLTDPPVPWAGAVFVADKTTNEEDETLVRPSFTATMLDSEDVGRLDMRHGSEETE
jgi:hypothetical protein